MMYKLIYKVDGFCIIRSGTIGSAFVFKYSQKLMFSSANSFRLFFMPF